MGGEKSIEDLGEFLFLVPVREDAEQIGKKPLKSLGTQSVVLPCQLAAYQLPSLCICKATLTLGGAGKRMGVIAAWNNTNLATGLHT